MNTKNNKRRRESREKIEKVFISLLQEREIAEISVSEICQKTGLNRSTFYANYLDVYDLADAIRAGLEQEVVSLFGSELSSKYEGDDWIKLFSHIKENPLFYKTYFKLGYDRIDKVDLTSLAKAYPEMPEKHLDYHVEFFKSGFNAIVKKWLAGGCVESPEEMNEILVNEYRRKDIH